MIVYLVVVIIGMIVVFVAADAEYGNLSTVEFVSVGMLLSVLWPVTLIGALLYGAFTLVRILGGARSFR